MTEPDSADYLRFAILNVAMWAAAMLVITGVVVIATGIPEALRKRGILTGSLPVPFWRMMLLRAVCAAFFLALIYLVPTSTSDHSGGYYPRPDTGKGPQWVALFVVMADAVWAVCVSTLRRWKS